MEEVVRKEIVKLFAACIIYPISDSPWVSPVQVVPTKGGYGFYCFLDVYSGYNQIPIAQKIKIRQPSHVLIEHMLIGECHLEKCHFMVTEGIILGHKITAKGIEVDKTKIDLIAGLPPPTTIKGIRSFLGHVGFYRRFIKDFSKISKPLTNLLMKDTKFNFLGDCLHAFETLEKKLSIAPVVVSPDWNQSFEVMCDASDI
ncbi:uncharacterized mitochondrial protein AtMg00860-like [Nicotiana sylvestris]|uniref:uncharacterized mitochondrial protein AtMg00860-like n=1 Tax=Nicotiana sylvestris TaxID=4096 RepID=UPI00388CB140